jgi:hypothetical protein
MRVGWSIEKALTTPIDPIRSAMVAKSWQARKDLSIAT